MPFIFDNIEFNHGRGFLNLPEENDQCNWYCRDDRHAVLYLSINEESLSEELNQWKRDHPSIFFYDYFKAEVQPEPYTTISVIGSESIKQGMIRPEQSLYVIIMGENI